MMQFSLFYKNAYRYFILFVILLSSCGKEKDAKVLTLDQLESAFEKFREKSIFDRRFTHAEVLPLINDRNGGFFVEEIGTSVKGKEIYQLSIGNGPTKVLLWSQMHGNESTATMALFDLFNFLEGKNDEFDSLRNVLFGNLIIRFIPIVNPDGMDEWKRRNALDIDLNRDAIALVSPESEILKQARDFFSPHFGFNLHDQQIYYNVSQTPKPATISVLAPAYNYETEVNEVRRNAMQVIVGMNQLLQEIIPGQVGKYDDAFEPRAFGDNFQKWGTSTILIESGGYPNDPEKQYIRKLNFMVILNALYQIAQKSHEKFVLDEYYAIPDNDTKLMDVILKNLQLNKHGYDYTVDLGIRRRESNSNGGFYVNGTIEDLGDLSIFYGYEELDAAGMEVVEGKIYEKEFENLSDITSEKALGLLKEGFLAVKVKEAEERELYNLPILVLKNSNAIPFEISTGGSPNFFLAKDGQLKHALVNGYLVNLDSPEKKTFKQKVL